MNKYIRYELSIDGQMQDVGFLVGLNDCGIPKEEIDNLLKHFNDSLNIVDLNKLELKSINAKFYFTEEGKKIFLKDIQLIIEKIESLGLFEVEKIELLLSSDDKRIIYKDDYQCLIE